MVIESIVLKTGNAIGYLVSAGLAIHAVNNAVGPNGNYKLAVFEGIASAYILFSNYVHGKKQERMQHLGKKIDKEYLPRSEALNQTLELLF